MVYKRSWAMGASYPLDAASTADGRRMTMDEYIEREALLHKMKMDIRPPFAVVRDFPAADVSPVRHGRWIYHDDGVITCSECGNAESRGSHYCRYCGAKIDLEG